MHEQGLLVFQDAIQAPVQPIFFRYREICIQQLGHGALIEPVPMETKLAVVVQSPVIRRWHYSDAGRVSAAHHAGSRIWKTTASCAQTHPVSGAACCSSAPHVPSRPPLCPRPGAAREEPRSDTLPRNLYSTLRRARGRALAPTENGSSPCCGRPGSRRRPAAFRGSAPPTPRPVPLSSAQRTRVRPAPAPEWCPGLATAPGCSGAGERLLFFKPTRDRVAGHAKGAGQTAQTGTLLIGA